MASPEFEQGFAAAIEAVRAWHLSQAKQSLIQSRRTRFPKNLEREAAVHERCAELIVAIRPDD